MFYRPNHASSTSPRATPVPEETAVKPHDYAARKRGPKTDFTAEDGQAEIDARGRQARTFRDNDRAFVNLSIYESRIHRTIEKATKQLTELQTERKAAERSTVHEALRLRDLNKSKGLPYNPEEDEFVYSTEKLEREANRRDHPNRSKSGITLCSL